MNKEWLTKRLIEVCEIKPPKSEARKRLKGNDLVSFLPMEDLGITTKYILANQKRKFAEVSGSYTYFADKDVLLAKITPCFENGKVGIARDLINGIGFGSSEYIVFRSKGEIDPEYLFYYISREQFRKEGCKAMAGAVGHKRVSKEFIENYLIPYPKSLPEQQRIVSILDEAFAAIARAKANAEQNLKNAKELFESCLRSVFETKGEDCKEKTLGEIAKVIGGYSFKSGDFRTEGQYQVIRMGNVRPGIIRENENPVFIDKLDDNILKRALLWPNDVIITQTGTKKKRDYGFTAIIEKENYLLNQRISAIRFSQNYLPKFFLYFSWTNQFRDQYFANETGTVGQGNVGIGAIINALVPVPSLKSQQAIVQKFDALLDDVNRLEAIYEQKINNLEELKKSILEKAFKGELKTLQPVLA
ncbi:MAG: restriction endonuclease subunit S [Cyclobacteriaceae bacterium]